MAIPSPGEPVRGSHSGRPIMALLDLLGRRWAMRIVWELRDTPLTFRELRERCDAMSPTVLNARLRELRETDVVEVAQPGGYTLSRSGKQLLEAMTPLLQWSSVWQRRLSAKDARHER